MTKSSSSRVPAILKISVPPTLIFTALCLFQAHISNRIQQTQQWWIIVHFLAVAIDYILTLWSLSPAARRSVSDGAHSHVTKSSAITVTRILGTCTAVQLLSLPRMISDEPLRQVASRVLCFFYAAKLLDLALRAQQPPVLLSGSRDRNISTIYVVRLLTEFRYHSFDIAVVSKGRTGPPNRLAHYGIPVCILVGTALLPVPETIAMSGLVVVQFGLETIHTLVHPNCLDPVFWQPFSAPAVSIFWNTHWQQCARPWLLSLGYNPAASLVGLVASEKVAKAVGVLATFSLSGIWHAWCAAALSTDPWRTAFGLWACFIGSGAICVLEGALYRDRRGGLLHLSLAWAFTIWSAGLWLRDSIVRSRLPIGDLG